MPARLSERRAGRRANHRLASCYWAPVIRLCASHSAEPVGSCRIGRIVIGLTAATATTTAVGRITIGATGPATAAGIGRIAVGGVGAATASTAAGVGRIAVGRPRTAATTGGVGRIAVGVLCTGSGARQQRTRATDHDGPADNAAKE